MAKRFVKSSINWVELEKRVPPEQKVQFWTFKGKSDLYMRRMLSNPAEKPKIDWEAYKKQVPVPGLVDQFKASYESIAIPYPEDRLSASVDQQWVALEPEIKKFCQEMETNIAAAKKEITRILSLPKYENMTMEMVHDLFPDDAQDFVKRPSFWPHTPDEQLGYKDPLVKI